MSQYFAQSSATHFSISETGTARYINDAGFVYRITINDIGSPVTTQDRPLNEEEVAAGALSAFWVDNPHAIDYTLPDQERSGVDKSPIQLVVADRFVLLTIFEPYRYIFAAIGDSQLAITVHLFKVTNFARLEPADSVRLGIAENGRGNVTTLGTEKEPYVVDLNNPYQVRYRVSMDEGATWSDISTEAHPTIPIATTSGGSASTQILVYQGPPSGPTPLPPFEIPPEDALADLNGWIDQVIADFEEELLAANPPPEEEAEETWWTSPVFIASCVVGGIVLILIVASIIVSTKKK